MFVACDEEIEADFMFSDCITSMDWSSKVQMYTLSRAEVDDLAVEMSSTDLLLAEGSSSLYYP